MKLKTSLFNPGIQKQNMKQHGWISLIYLIGLLFSVPLQMVLYAADENRTQYQHVEHLFNIGFPLQLLMSFIIPIIAGIFLFRYLQTKSAADMIHSLPIKRGTLYVNHVISGAVMLMIPVWLTAIAASMAVNAYSVFEFISVADVWIWTIVMTIMSLFYFCFSVFIGMMTGMSVAQGILTFIILMLPAGLFVLISTNLNYYLYGFSNEYYTGETITRWAPIVMMSEFNHTPDIPVGRVLIYLFLTVLFGAVGYILYKIRQIETAGQAITFQPLRPIFKYGVTICTMLLGGVYFEQYGTIEWLVFGYIFASLLGYLIAEMILQKTWRIWNGKTFIHYAGYAGMMVILAFVINMDVLGYESNVPDDNQIESVYFGNDVYPLTNSENTDIYISDESYIKNVKELHEYIVQTKPEQVDAHTPYGNNRYVIAYQLENGSTLVRQYELPIEAVEEKLAGIMESEPYKRMQYHVNDLDQELDNIVITASGPIQKNVTISNTEEIQELQQILKYEISSMKLNEMTAAGMNWGHILLEPAAQEENPLLNQPQPDIPWKKSFHELEQWLDEKGYLEQARVMPEDINALEILRVPGGTRGITYPDQVFREQNEQGMEQLVKVKDTEVIEEALEQYRNIGEGEYFVRFLTNNRRTELYGVFPENQVPDKIISAYNNE
ncbi:DUF6449 domain-containing protein [Alteribacillus bidgolensis]|uniref:ABC-2 type transport system permease protein n=1 Tax=Alteribacillus bidgolensis TaxID=930129 RepID=A0A1G8KZ84_9BACI|nr:DUF6449 domain-containing protein [Alteribacillus bidgolensis]SDI48825.1 ABC-2 type transport system permease protein [Alteribacillus bidgolensis]